MKRQRPFISGDWAGPRPAQSIRYTTRILRCASKSGALTKVATLALEVAPSLPASKDETGSRPKSENIQI